MRALALLVREARQGEYVLSRFLRDNAEECVELGFDRDAVDRAQAIPDEVLGPKIVACVRGRQEKLAAERHRIQQQRTGEAARRLATTAEWRADRVYLSVTTLLDDLLADPAPKYISLDALDRGDVPILRATLVDLARAVRPFDVLAAWLDPGGLHVTWCAGRGGIRLKARRVERSDLARVLHVELAPPCIPLPVPALLTASVHPRPRNRWLEAVLDGLVLGT